MKDIDKGFKETIKKLQILQSKTLQAGILSNAGTNTKTGEYIADYALVNEYGGHTKEGHEIPSRSFMRSTYNEQKSKWDAMVDRIIDKIVDDPRSNVEELIGKFGAQVVGDIKEKISSDIPPKNSPLTIAIKTKDNPNKKVRTLIDTSVMRNNIKYEIVDK